MLLSEMAEEYDEAVELLTQRITDLKCEKSSSVVLSEQALLTVRIHDLESILRDTKKLASICRNYYERSFWRDARFCFQFQKRRTARRSGRVAARKCCNQRRANVPATQKSETRNPGGPDESATDHAVDAILKGIFHGPDCRRARSKSVHRVQNTGQGQ